MQAIQMCKLIVILAWLAIMALLVIGTVSNCIEYNEKDDKNKIEAAWNICGSGCILLSACVIAILYFINNEN